MRVKEKKLDNPAKTYFRIVGISLFGLYVLGGIVVAIVVLLD
jgi:hypothetical protein